MPASCNAPPQTNPQKPEDTLKVLQIAQERSDLSSVVRTLLGPEDHYEPTQLPTGQYLSHDLSLLHRKYCFPSFVNSHQSTFWRPLHYVTGMNSTLFSTLLKPWNYYATTGTHRWKISCLYCTKSVLSNYTSKEQVLRRWAGKAPSWPFRSVPARRLRHSST